ncbi:Transcriptional regulator, AraC family [Labilithrix luteola]|uniref:Transcriptional regulator, AraC family n=1 Tax=Labilithrix luteola TaxID=1391654 RepID=A0A0K1PTD0_9BACT|nr:GlxA family transcriptional regulator [Labilithrix luteola]AKU96641.1 Transcriptional regulator, AraC family [Labilithrix luteola]
MTKLRAARASEPTDVGFLVFPWFQSLDLSGPLEVFTCASVIARERGRGEGYRTTLFAEAAGPIRSFSGIDVVAQRGLGARTVDTLVVVGGPGVVQAAEDPRLVRFVQRMATRARRVASVCTGAFVLGAAGLLDGRRATTHWEHTRSLAHLFPKATVDEDAIYTRDGSVYTSAGITAGMDLALALVEEDYGRDLALAVARYLVMALQRAGGQSQFSVQLRSQTATRDPLRAVQSYVYDNLGADLSVPTLARKAGMSPRNFARLFGREVGTTPATFVEQARIDAARRLLEQTSRSIEEIADAAGFGRAESLRRAFARNLSVSPQEYRNRFHA